MSIILYLLLLVLGIIYQKHMTLILHLEALFRSISHLDTLEMITEGGKLFRRLTLDRLERRECLLEWLRLF